MGLLGIVVYIFEMYIRPQDWMPFMYGFPLVDVIGSVVLMIAIFSMLAEKRPLALPQIYFVLFFLIMVVLSNVFNNTGETFAYFITYAKRAAVFFMFLFIIKSTKQLKAVLAVIVLLTVLLAIQAIYQTKTGVGLAGQPLVAPKSLGGGRPTWVGAWDGPNVLCLLFVIATALSSGFIGRAYNSLWRGLNFIFIGILLVGVYVTNSRGGFIGLLAVVFTYCWIKLIKNKRLSVKIISMLFAVGLIIIGFKLGPPRISELNTKESSAHERSWLWEQAVNATRESPIFGIGKGQFSFSGYTAAHSNFIQNMTEMGLPGLFIYIGLVYLSLKGLFLVIKSRLVKEKNPKLVSIATALFISMVGYTVVTFFVTMELDILFAWIGLCAAVVNVARKEIGQVSLKFNLKDAVVVLAGMAVVMFAVYLIAFKEII